MSLKTENSRRVAKSRPVCMGLKAGRKITAGWSPVKVTGQLNFSSDIPNFCRSKLFSLKQSLVKYTPKNMTIFPV
jgi:hypothetical protein